MDQLPEAMLTPSKPFKVAGVGSQSRSILSFHLADNAKVYEGYICLFVYIYLNVHEELLCLLKLYRTPSGRRQVTNFALRGGHYLDPHRNEEQ